MIFPSVTLGCFELDGKLVFSSCRKINLLDRDLLQVANKDFLKDFEIFAMDGARALVRGDITNWDGNSYRLIFGEHERDFENCTHEHFGDGWFVARYCTGEHAHNFFAYDYSNDRLIQFLDDANRIYFSGGLFFVSGGGSWKVYDKTGVVIERLEIEEASSFLEYPYFYLVGDNVFLGGGGLGGNKKLHVFSLVQGRLLESVTWGSHINSLAQVGSDYYFIDHQYLYKLDPVSPKNSPPLTELPAHDSESVCRGYERLWWDGHSLYLASYRSSSIYAYDLTGQVLHVASIPSGGRVTSAASIGSALISGMNVVLIRPTDQNEMGTQRILIWAPGEFASPSTMAVETIETWSFEQIPGKKDKYGYRIQAADASGDRVARHTAYHLTALVDKVAPGTLNGARIGEKSFNGTLELILTTPQRADLEFIHLEYLLEVFKQMRSIPFSYRASNNRDPLTLKIFWQGAEGEGSELLYDSKAETTI